MLEDIENVSVSKFTPNKHEPLADSYFDLDDNFKLSSHKCNIFRTPEKDDFILTESPNSSPTTQFLDLSDAHR